VVSGFYTRGIRMKLLDVIFGRLIDRRIAKYQNTLITKHYDEVQNIYTKMRGWRHDYHNHIQALLVLNGNAKQTKEYLLKLNDDLTSVDTLIKTGNVMIDAILNSKISLIKSKSIAVNAKAVVPPHLPISEIDLCVIIGNLLDNAMEACEKQSVGEERFIRIFIGVMKSQLYITVSNSVGGEVHKSGKAYLSTKNSDSHGFGLMRIDNIVNKYGGYLNRQNEDRVFATEVLLPM
jgi:sensor histidine kinase regulating citrate/malate metabolism